MQTILVSACLLGENCRYNGIPKACPAVQRLSVREDVRLIPVCPEVDGGLSTPREPSEQREGRVFMKSGRDVTEEFRLGAQKALQAAKENGCTLAVLKERSPSCGHDRIYDGTFTGTLTDGNGIAAGLLIKNGIRVIGESEADSL